MICQYLVMHCPYCGSSQIMVTNSRPTFSNSQVWRRRKCLSCKGLFTTHEVIDLSHLIVIKKSGRREKYSRVKLYAGIYNSTSSLKSRVEIQKFVQLITRKVEKEVLLLKKRNISSQEIGEIVLTKLKSISPGAFLSFLINHKNINNERQMKKYLEKYI